MNYLKIPKMFKYLFQWKVTVNPSTKFVKNLVRSTTNTNKYEYAIPFVRKVPCIKFVLPNIRKISCNYYW